MGAGSILEVHRAAGEGEDAGVGESAVGAGVIEGERSDGDGGATAVGVVGGEDERAFALFGEAERATDHAGGVEGLGGVGDRPGLGGAEGHGGADGVGGGA